mmetsp:Transcript_43149/g.90647  ORF Transcript_43149/g.90647 Transcript_43149/m.90647 type:complete len:308 (-) Transcript_43149:62-985(-)
MPRSNNSTKTTFKYDGTQSVPRDVEYAETLPGVKKIAARAFQGCTKLKWFICHEGVEMIEKRAFNDCRSLERFTCPSTLADIGNGAFLGCHELKEVVLNEGLEKIGGYAFIRCPSLERFTCPSTLADIGNGAFLGCHELKEVVLNEGLEKIGARAFIRCLSLGGLKFPSISKHLGMVDCESDKADILTAINGTSHVSMVEGEVLISGAPLEGGNNWMVCKGNIERIRHLIALVKLKEATTVFELALWKEMMMDGRVVGDINRNREAFYIDVPGPIKNAVTQFIPNKQTDDVSDNSLGSSDSDSDGDY